MIEEGFVPTRPVTALTAAGALVNPTGCYLLSFKFRWKLCNTTFSQAYEHGVPCRSGGVARLLDLFSPPVSRQRDMVGATDEAGAATLQVPNIHEQTPAVGKRGRNGMGATAACRCSRLRS